MEDDILHFLEGVHEDDVVGIEFVGMVALREDRKIVSTQNLQVCQNSCP